MAVNMSKLWEIVEDYGMLQTMGSQRVGHDLATKQRQAWAYLYHLVLAASGSHRNIANGERVFK